MQRTLAVLVAARAQKGSTVTAMSRVQIATLEVLLRMMVPISANLAALVSLLLRRVAHYVACAQLVRPVTFQMRHHVRNVKQASLLATQEPR